MTSRALIVTAMTLGVIAAPALAHPRHKSHLRCIPQRQEFSLAGLLFNPHPQPNGCAPPVYVNGEYVGQDPDPFIRLQLEHNPATGYAYDQGP